MKSIREYRSQCKRYWDRVKGFKCEEKVIELTNVHIILIPSRDDWKWGYSDAYYDGTWHSFGIGPVALISWGPT